MTQTWDRGAPALVQIQRLLLAALAATLLLVGFTGNAGVQVLDHDLAVRIARLHLHGVAGEAEYIRDNAAPAPFIHPHCHGPAPEVAAQPSPDEVQAAAALAGLMTCATVAPLRLPPVSALAKVDAAAVLPAGLSLLPILPPPQA